MPLLTGVSGVAYLEGRHRSGGFSTHINVSSLWEEALLQE